ncbi:MAG: precorrin-6A reductase [Acidaminococcaceae bacterium]|nr:precorrin-6A reductase [Acidaminococcaceae bacterium]MDD4722524.1 precorrin-6A reductase [Acidaminococcaceae bacterium]
MKTKPVVWIIAGTSEGRKLIKYFANKNVELIVSVATEYGAQLIEPQENLTVKPSRMDCGAMESFLDKYKPCLVIDATHPFATIVTETIKKACTHTQSNYLRFLRPAGDSSDCIEVNDYEDAVDFLCHVDGNIFLTTGSKTLELFAQIPNYHERVTLRILPMLSSLEKAHNLGFAPAKIICMQGPFSEQLNVAMFQEAKAKYVVTKESGDAGGFQEKKVAAIKAGAQLVVIKRKLGDIGNDFTSIYSQIEMILSKEAGRC